MIELNPNPGLSTNPSPKPKLKPKIKPKPRPKLTDGPNSKRGRSRADKTSAEIENSRVELQTDRVEEAHSPNRPPRVPMGATLKLEFGKVTDDPAYHFHVISDRDGRIQQAKQGWYEHVKDENGDNMARHCGRYVQYLMKIKKEYWDADQKLKQDKLCASIKKEQKVAPGEYLPDGRHHVLQKDDYDPLA